MTLAIVLYGCGPGFPIMTAGQESYLKDVDNLKERVSSIEGGSTTGAAEIKEDINNINVEMADAMVGLEELRQELSFIRGTIEEADFDRGQIKETTQAGNDAMGETLKVVSERVEALEEGLLKTGEKLDAIMASLDLTSKTNATQDETDQAMDLRLKALESEGPKAAAKAAAKSQDPEDLYSEGFKAIKNKDFREASDKFEEFISEHPKHRLAGHAQYWIGEIYYANGDWEKAILEFDKVIKGYPEGTKVPAATLKQGYSFEKMGLMKEARVLLGNVIEKFPKSAEAAKAKNRLKKMATSKN
jgi:tol-pal system protein YbgF